MMNKKYIVGADIGTSGCKAVIIDAAGRVKGKSFIHYKTVLKQGGAEQDPDSWVQAFEKAVKEALIQANARPRDIVVVGIDGMMNTPVFLQSNGRPLRPAILWMDQRSAPQAAKLSQVLGGLKVNGPITATALLAKATWLADKEPEIWTKTSYIVLAKDYVRYKLTGIICTDPSDASATQLFDVARNVWSREICDIFNISTAKLPTIIASHEIIGKIKNGLLKNVPVVVGCSDAAADNLAAGIVNDGDCLIRLGTCGALFLVHEQPPQTSNQYYVLTHCIPGRWFNHNLTPAGIALDWFVKIFGLRSFNVIDKLAVRAPIGAGGVFFYPYLLGEHTPRVGKPLSGGFIGLTGYHRLSHLARAVLEGVAFSVRECFETLGQTASERVKTITIAGGGARSSVWPRILADVIGEKLRLPRALDASFGAALLGGIGAGVFADVSEAIQRCVTLKSTVLPRPKPRQLYSTLFKHYIMIAEVLWGNPPAEPIWQSNA